MRQQSHRGGPGSCVLPGAGDMGTEPSAAAVPSRVLLAQPAAMANTATRSKSQDKETREMGNALKEPRCSVAWH